MNGKFRCQDCNQLYSHDRCSCGWQKTQQPNNKISSLLCQYVTDGEPCILPGTMCEHPYSKGPWYCRYHMQALSKPEQARKVLQEIRANYSQIMEKMQNWRDNLFPHLKRVN